MMRFNIFHRPGSGVNYDLFRRQQDLAHGFGFKTTIFLFYEDLFHEHRISDALADQRAHGDEIAISLHGLGGPGLSEVTNGQIAPWLLDAGRKETVFSAILAKFREVFQMPPQSAGAYHLDASALRVLRRVEPAVATIIGGCFEEGVRVFHGCNHSWYLFNEGMPWGPWYPSKTHTLRPAADEADAAGVVAVPHLVRDLALSYEGRNDFWASHPPNVIRGMGNEATWCPYDLNLVDQFRMQERWNGGHSYYNTFISPGWLDWNHNSEYPPEVSWELYRKFLEYMAKLKSDGELEDMTLSEYGAWHRAHRPIGGTDVFLAKEMLYGSGKHYFWFCDAMRRVAIDAAQGGSIGDLRPYSGRIPVSTGPDTPHREIGSYPYLIHSQHRSGAAHHFEDGARTTCLLARRGEVLDLCDFKTKVAAIDRGDRTVLTLEPVHFRFADGASGSLVTRYLFDPVGTIVVEREVAATSDNLFPLSLTEYFKGAPGRTEYAEDLSGIILQVDGDSAKTASFDYSGATHVSANASRVGALVPSAGVLVELSADRALAHASFKAGHLFSPFFTLALRREIPAPETTKTCLTLTPIVK